MYYRQVRDVLMAARAGAAVCFLLGLFAPPPVFSAPSDSMLAGSTTLSNGLTMYFRLYVPRSYTKTKKYPIVVTLHGVGEKGSDNRIQVDNENITHQWMLDSVQTKYAPFILCPQCPNSGSIMWSSNAGDGTAGIPDSGVIKILDSLKKVYSLDTTRFYVAGLSMGGAGSWAMVKSFSQKFAAAVPCAGSMGLNSTVASLTPFASTIVKTPYWSFHGTSDASVPVVCDYRIDTVVRNAGYSVIHYVSSKNMTNPTETTTDSLRKAVAAGALRLLTLVTNGVHGDGWAEAWFHPFLVPWVFSKSKVNGQTVFTWPAPGPGETAIVMERQAPPSLSGKLRIANGTIRWNGVSRLPARIDIYSAKGTVVMRHAVGQRDGTLQCFALAKGIYCIEINAPGWSERKVMTLYENKR
jgi:poly(3-hydroxybutyrate) depolymerase